MALCGSDAYSEEIVKNWEKIEKERREQINNKTLVTCGAVHLQKTINKFQGGCNKHY